MSQYQAYSQPAISRTTNLAALVGLEPQSVLGIIYEDRPFVIPHTNQLISGEYLADYQTASGPVRVPAVEIALENGNSETRSMALHFFTHKAVIMQTPSTYEEQVGNVIYSSGEAGESWQEEYLEGKRSKIFRIGEHAANQQNLPIGSTNERWRDPRFVRFNHACIVRTLANAGYGPGTHYICVCPGARNEEVSVTHGVNQRVTEALSAGLQSFVIWRNGKERYDVRVVEVTRAIPQTYGSHEAYDTDLLGRSLHPNVPRWDWLDVGYYDSHDVRVARVGKRLEVSGTKITDGVSSIVRGLGNYLRLPENFPQIPPLSYAEALEIMRTGEVKIAGMPLDDEYEIARGRALVNEYKDEAGGSLFRTMISNHSQNDSVLGFTGGGLIDFDKQIRDQTKNRPANLTKILPGKVSRIANVAGIYWLLQLAKRRQAVLRTQL